MTILRLGPMSSGPTALLSGEIHVRADGCVEVWQTNNDLMVDRWTVLWPAGAHLHQVGADVRVLVGDEAVRPGDTVSLGGGEAKDQKFVESLVGDVGPCASEQYWITTSVAVLGR